MRFKPALPLALLLAPLLALPFAPLAAQPVPAPAGWTAAQSGANWIYTPANLPPGETFTLTFAPTQSLGGQPLDQWLTEHARTDVDHRGTRVGTIATQHNPNDTWVAQAAFRDPRNQSWIALYTATPRGQGEAQLSTVVTNLPAQTALDYVRTAGTIVGTAARTPAPPAIAQANTQPNPTFTLLHEGRGQSTATGYAYIESTDLLLNDGSAYLGLTIPPELLDVAASKQHEPTKWRRWKQSGTDVVIESAPGQWTKLTADRARPLPSGSALHVTLTHRNATTFGGMGSYNTSGTITLLPTGRYQRSQGVIAGTGTVQAGGGFTGSASSYQNQTGRASASAGSNGQVTATTRSHGAGDPNAGGTYKISGYTLELDGDGGHVERLLAFYPFTDDTRVYINGVTYNRDGR